MTEKRFTLLEDTNGGLDTILETMVKDNGKFLTHKECCDLLNELSEENEQLRQKVDFYKYFQKDARELEKENEQLKSQLYCNDEEGVCNICKHHYLIKDDEAELGYYNSRCKKGHYECARVSLKYCKDFEKELEE